MSIITNKTKEQEFKNMLNMKQEELHMYLSEVMPSYFEEDKIIDQYGDFLYCEGDFPVLLVAHLDTVHKRLPGRILFDKEEGVMWSENGIGGDDRCGVWSILETLDKGYRPSIVFTWNEEIGGIGASAFCQDMTESMLKDINFAIEIDRRGGADCVFYDLEYPEFEAFIQEHNFKTAIGSFSDISTICPHFKFAGVNLSAGYFNEHTDKEYIDINAMEYTIDRIASIFEDVRAKEHWEWKGIDYTQWYKKYSYGYGGYYEWDEDYYDDYGNYGAGGKTKKVEKNNKIVDWCANCQTLVNQSDMAPAPYEDMCKECMKKLNITEEYCQSCGCLTKIDDFAEYPNELICKKCYQEVLDWDKMNREAFGKEVCCDSCKKMVPELETTDYPAFEKPICMECYKEIQRAAQAF